MDKIDRLLDAIEHPECYTSMEIETMLHDTEVKEAFHLLDKTKSSLHPSSVPDVEHEWKKFRGKHNNSKRLNYFRLTRFVSRNAVASITIGIASFAAVAAVVGIGIKHLTHNAPVTPQIEVNANTGIAISQPDSTKSVETDKAKLPETVVFDNETLENIINKIADYYEYTVIFSNDTSKSLRLYFRWKPALTIEDVAEQLSNFEQIHITVNDKTIKID